MNSLDTGLTGAIKRNTQDVPQAISGRNIFSALRQSLVFAMLLIFVLVIFLYKICLPRL
jgi:hypothetical protein